MRRSLIAAAALLCCAASHSQDIRSEYAANRVIVTINSANNGWSGKLPGNTPAGEARIMKMFPGAAPGGNTVPMKATAKITGKGVAVVAAKWVGRAIPGVGAGIMAWDIYDAVRVRPVPGGGLAADPGQDPQTMTTTLYQGSFQCGGTYCSALMPVGTGGGWFTSPNQAAESVTAGRVAAYSNPNYTRTWAVGACTTGGGQFSCATTVTTCPVISGPCSTGADSPVQGVMGQASRDLCPAFVDFNDPQYSKPAGSPPGFDGKCPTGSYTVPMTADEAADMRANATAGNQPNWDDVMNDVLGRTPAGTEIPVTNDWDLDVEVPAPAKVDGPSSSTTNADGSSTSQATRWDFAKTPNVKRSVDVTQTTTTTTRDASGNVVGSPTVTTSTTAGAAGDPSKDPCVGDPGRIGCLGLGTVPDDVPLQKVDKTVTFAPMVGFGATTATCPTPPTMSFLGNSIAIDNTLFCSFFSGMKYVIVGMAFIVGALIFVGGMKD